MNSDNVEVLARKLHEWYLEATGQLDPKNYNPEAQVPYDKLRPQQQDIDKYIAGQIQALFASKFIELIGPDEVILDLMLGSKYSREVDRRSIACNELRAELRAKIKELFDV